MGEYNKLLSFCGGQISFLFFIFYVNKFKNIASYKASGNFFLDFGKQNAIFLTKPAIRLQNIFCIEKKNMFFLYFNV